MTSFGLQALVTGVLLLLPLLRPTGLPSFRQLSTPISLGQPLAEAPATRAHTGSSSAPANRAVIVFNRTSPPIGRPAPGDDGPPQVTSFGPDIPGATGSGDSRGLPTLFGGGTRPVLPAAPPPVTVAHPLRLSHMNAGDLIRKVQPEYPALARSARIQGAVVLQAVISKQGMIENLRVLTGHPMLVPAAIDAVRQWRYRPYILNGEPVEVETQVTVNFSLGGS
ncbi:MAG: energy transducer TonB [Candidatus Sulfotelmatobacter sp.]